MHGNLIKSGIEWGSKFKTRSFEILKLIFLTQMSTGGVHLDTMTLSRLRNLKTLLIDLSGTIHIEDEATPRALEALNLIRKAKLPAKFTTNTTKESQNFLYKRLSKIGLPIDKNDIFSSLTATKKYIESNGLRPYFLMEEEALEEFSNSQISTNDPNAVVIGLSPSMFDYNHLNEAFRILLKGHPLIACHKGRYFKTKSGLSLGPGPFVNALEYAAGTKAMIIGKPEPNFYTSALKEIGGDPASTAMIGDDINDDVVGAQKVGMFGILVKTGKYRPGDEGFEGKEPDLTVENFYEAVKCILLAKGMEDLIESD